MNAHLRIVFGKIPPSWLLSPTRILLRLTPPVYIYKLYISERMMIKTYTHAHLRITSHISRLNFWSSTTSFYFNPSHILNIWGKISATPIAKPKKFIEYNSGDIFYQEEGILTLVLRLLKTTALQIRLFVVLIMTSKFFVTELNSRCMIISGRNLATARFLFMKWRYISIYFKTIWPKMD